MIKVEDYLHYYLGQSFFFDNKKWQLRQVGHILVRLRP